jgi:hypothetical protein
LNKKYTSAVQSRGILIHGENMVLLNGKWSHSFNDWENFTVRCRDIIFRKIIAQIFGEQKKKKKKKKPNNFSE